MRTISKQLDEYVVLNKPIKMLDFRIKSNDWINVSIKCFEYINVTYSTIEII